jgi:hypothetical protein
VLFFPHHPQDRSWKVEYFFLEIFLMVMPSDIRRKPEGVIVRSDKVLETLPQLGEQFCFSFINSFLRKADIALDKAVRQSKQVDFRHNEFKERRIKQALFKVLNDKDEVERVYNIVVEQGEY